jgi:hypothetical protein
MRMTQYSNRNVYVDGTDIVRRIYIDYEIHIVVKSVGMDIWLASFMELIF